MKIISLVVFLFALSANASDEYLLNSKSKWVSGVDTTWSAVNGYIANSPIVGPEIIINGDFGSSDGWSLAANWAIGSGVLSATSAAQNSLATQTGVYTLGQWYVTAYTVVSGSGVWPYENTTAIVPGSHHRAIQGGAFNFKATANPTTSSVDNLTVKNIPTHQLFFTTKAGTSDHRIDTAIAGTGSTSYTVVGAVVALDNPSNPQNFVCAYWAFNGSTRIIVDKCVNGVYYRLISPSTTYVAGQVITIKKVGSVFNILNNGVDITGSPLTITDASIIRNRQLGLMSSSPLGQFSSIYASNISSDGTESKFSQLK